MSDAEAGLSKQIGSASTTEIELPSNNGSGVNRQTNEDLLRSELAGATDEEREQLLKKYAFLLDDSTYRVFTPESFNDDNNKGIVHLFEKNRKEKFNQRLYRAFVAIAIPLILFPFLIILKQDVVRMLGYALLCMFIAYFIHIFSIFLRAARKPRDEANIYRMYSLSSIAPGWTVMSVAYRVYAFEKHPISSISEFSAIDGGIAQTMLLTISCYSWGVILCAIAFEIEDKLGYNDNDTGLALHDAINVADVAGVIGCFGLVLIGTFDLDPFNPKAQNLHNSGAALGVGTLLAFWWQQYVIGTHENDIGGRIWFPTLCSFIALIAFLFWQYYGAVAQTFPPKTNLGIWLKLFKKCINSDGDPKDVTAVSLKNVISEAIFLFLGSLSMCLWLVNYHECHQQRNNQCRLK